jgi:hypothetical protein
LQGSLNRSFVVDGTHAQVAGLNDYVVADSGGTVYDYPFGQSTRRWRLDLGGSVTGTPLVMADPAGGRVLDLIPLSGQGCDPSTYCVGVEVDGGSFSTPSRRCNMAAGGAVLAQPGAGRSFPAFAFTADANGGVNALDTSNGSCDVEDSSQVSGAAVGSVVVFPCSGCGRTTDEVYVLTTSAGSSRLYHLTYTSKGLNEVDSALSLPWGNARGLAVESQSLPARLAISFAAGEVAMVQIGSNAKTSLTASAVLPGGPLIADAPYWCTCPSANLIGVTTQSGSQDGALYVLDPSLNRIATYSVATAISTTPGTDAAGDWLFGGEDGNLYEAPAGQSNVIVVTRSGAVDGGVGSGVQVGGCGSAICIYFGSRRSAAHIMQLDARDSVLIACITISSTCADQGPRLWAQVEVDTASSTPTVHVQGWSYYSP